MTEKETHAVLAQRALGFVCSDCRPPESPCGVCEIYLAYVELAQALEADTVSRAEHEDVRASYATEVNRLGNQLTALQAELELAKMRAEDERDESIRRGQALATERARAEEAERQGEREYITACGLRTELAAANARAVRLEEEMRRVVYFANLNRTLEPAEREEAAAYYKQYPPLSTAPQASTEQASPSPAVGEAFPPRPPGACDCHRCWKQPAFGSYMVVCAKCGNKRCPKAEWHGFRCTGSNATGQVGTPEEPPQPAPSVEAGRVQTSLFRQVAEASVQPAPGGTEREDEFGPDNLPYSFRVLPDPTPAEPQGRPEQTGDRVDQLRADVASAFRALDRGVSNHQVADLLEGK